tara:strand:- start:203 stop:424 length:222 start_codon:yes stop_codon:yes gene_type:complete
MIDLNETSKGDLVWFKVWWQSRPLYGEVLKVIPDEEAVEVMTPLDGYRTVWNKNAFFDEKSAKKGTYQKYGSV